MIFTDILSYYSLSPSNVAFLVFAAILIGISKTGIIGTGILVVPVLANIFGGRISTGVLLPMLIITDVYAVTYYRRFASWKHLMMLLPSAFIGIGIATLVGKDISDSMFRICIAAMIFIGLIIMVWEDFQPDDPNVPDNKLLAGFTGVMAGFATMIGNASGPIMSIYLLTMRIPKNVIIGTAAWYYLIINLSKLPLQLWVWKTINVHSLSLNLFLVPFILIGAFAGIRIARYIPERIYRYIITVVVAIAAVIMIFR